MRMQCMIDIETLSLASNAAILSIGAIKFDLDEPSVNKVVEQFHVNIDMASYRASVFRPLPLPFDIDGKTVEWWMTGERDAARIALFELEKTDLASALDAFGTWYNGTPTPADGRVLPARPNGVWSNGATFDVPVMEHAFGVFGIECPWTYREVCCYRTINKLLGREVPYEMIGVAHSALDDAAYQTRRLRHMLRMIDGARIPQPPAEPASNATPAEPASNATSIKEPHLGD